ncbi:MAG: DUF2254 domain-containing protein [Deltaproteobacteria bacterium]|nr:DUF2254 domain-containing protein [Nannocystaceae bacterium]
MGERPEDEPRAAARQQDDEREREANAAATLAGRTVGLLVQFRRSAGLPGATWSLPVLMISGIASIIYLLSFWLDIATASGHRQGNEGVTFLALFDTILDQDVDQARNTLGGLGEVMAAVLGLALTVSSIIVQLAATRFTPHITALFFRARTNLVILGFFVTSSIYVLWVNFSLGDHYLPHWGVLFSMLLMTASLLLLFPYFAYVFNFLDPETIVGRIMYDGLAAATPLRGRAGLATDTRQMRAVEAVEHLANIGLNALQQKDKGIASEAVDALCEYGIRYGETKAAMRQEWHRIASWNRQSPDFVSLSDDAVDDLRKRGTWLEWKIMRQYQMLFGEGLGQIKDTCYLIAIDTRRLGEAAGRRGDVHALDLAIKFFNTYLRATLNASDIRTAYNILHQYRQLAEFVLTHSREIASDVERREGLEHRALQIARFMRYYSAVAYQRGLAFVTEVIAHDVCALCQLAFIQRSRAHDEFLSVFLAVDEHAETKEQEKSLRGVRRAQTKLATTYLMHGAEHHARRIQRDMADEPLDRLRSIWQELESLESREFWEVNDRGTNFDYLSPEQKNRLETFFGWFEGLEPIASIRARMTTSALLPEPSRPAAAK